MILFATDYADGTDFIANDIYERECGLHNPPLFVGNYNSLESQDGHQGHPYEITLAIID